MSSEFEAANTLAHILQLLNKLQPVARASVIANVVAHYGMIVADSPHDRKIILIPPIDDEDE